MTIGIAGDKNAKSAEHEITPEAFNGWPLFGRGGNGGHVPIAGPEDDTPIEVGIDLSPLLKKLGPDKDEKGKLFLQLSRADGSKVNGELHEAAVRLYDPRGKLVRESAMKIETGKFGESPLQINTTIHHLGQK